MREIEISEEPIEFYNILKLENMVVSPHFSQVEFAADARRRP